MLSAMPTQHIAMYGLLRSPDTKQTSYVSACKGCNIHSGAIGSHETKMGTAVALGQYRENCNGILKLK